VSTSIRERDVAVLSRNLHRRAADRLAGYRIDHGAQQGE